MEERLDRIEGKVDQLLEAFNMGRGGARAIAKLGGFMILTSAALGWLWQNVIGPLLGRTH
jgi:hypothetical protein